MVSFRKPSVQKIEAFLAAQQMRGFSYRAVGATASVPPAGYNVDHTRIKVGEGEQAFLAARSAIQTWTHFRLGWVEAKASKPTIAIGDMVTVSGRTFGLWWLNACRIVYVIDESAPVARFGFAYGTTPDHAGSGEERFLVEWDRQTNIVWYDILAFSRPHGLLSHLGYPWLRFLQHRFGKESGAAMVKAVGEAGR